MIGSKRLLQLALLFAICLIAITTLGGKVLLAGEESANRSLTDVREILGRLTFAKRLTVHTDGQAIDMWTGARTVGEVLRLAGVNLGPLDRVEPGMTKAPVDGMEVNVIRVVEQLVQEEVVRPYRTVKLASRSMNRGESREVTPGVNGKVVNTYKVVIENGQVQAKTLVSSVTAVETQDRMVEEGTISTITRDGEVLRFSKALNVVATAYTADINPATGKPDDAWGGMTASGKQAVPGLTIAADLRVLPMYSRVYVEGTDAFGKRYSGIYQVMDKGGAIKGNRIDIFMLTFDETYNFGRRKMKVYLLE